MKVSVKTIKPNPINEQIYSATDIDDLELSLQTHGQLEPIVINKKNTLISGHRRFYAIKRLGWEECEVRISEPKNDIVSLIEFNRHRVKSVTDILNEVPHAPARGPDGEECATIFVDDCTMLRNCVGENNMLMLRNNFLPPHTRLDERVGENAAETTIAFCFGIVPLVVLILPSIFSSSCVLLLFQDLT